MLYAYHCMQLYEAGIIIIIGILHMRNLGLGKLSGSPKITANKGESIGSNTCCLAPKPSPLSLTVGGQLWWLASKVIHYNQDSIMIIKQGGLWSVNQAMVSRVCSRICNGKLLCWAFQIYFWLERKCSKCWITGWHCEDMGPP